MIKDISKENIESRIETYCCDVCGKETYKIRDSESIFADENMGFLRIQIASNNECIHAEIKDICKECSGQKAIELTEILAKMGFFKK